MFAYENYVDMFGRTRQRLVLSDPDSVRCAWRVFVSLGGLEGGSRSRWFNTYSEAQEYLASLPPEDESWGEERRVYKYYLIPVDELREALPPRIRFSADNRSACIAGWADETFFTVHDSYIALPDTSIDLPALPAN